MLKTHRSGILTTHVHSAMPQFAAIDVHWTHASITGLGVAA